MSRQAEGLTEAVHTVRPQLNANTRRTLETPGTQSTWRCPRLSGRSAAPAGLCAIQSEARGAVEILHGMVVERNGLSRHAQSNRHFGNGINGVMFNRTARVFRQRVAIPGFDEIELLGRHRRDYRFALVVPAEPAGGLPGHPLAADHPGCGHVTPLPAAHDHVDGQHPAREDGDFNWQLVYFDARGSWRRAPCCALTPSSTTPRRTGSIRTRGPWSVGANRRGRTRPPLSGGNRPNTPLHHY